jgi:hypothetical protein
VGDLRFRINHARINYKDAVGGVGGIFNESYAPQLFAATPLSSVATAIYAAALQPFHRSGAIGRLRTHQANWAKAPIRDHLSLI